jgi:hypothetical protein
MTALIAQNKRMLGGFVRWLTPLRLDLCPRKATTTSLSSIGKMAAKPANGGDDF